MGYTLVVGRLAPIKVLYIAGAKVDGEPWWFKGTVSSLPVQLNGKGKLQQEKNSCFQSCLFFTKATANGAYEGKRIERQPKVISAALKKR